jgi:hypothetical protein
MKAEPVHTRKRELEWARVCTCVRACARARVCEREREREIH